MVLNVNSKNAIESLKDNHELFYKDKLIPDYWDTYSSYKYDIDRGFKHDDDDQKIVESFVKLQESTFREALSNPDTMIPFKVKKYNKMVQDIEYSEFKYSFRSQQEENDHYDYHESLRSLFVYYPNFKDTSIQLGETGYWYHLKRFTFQHLEPPDGMPVNDQAYSQYLFDNRGLGIYCAPFGLNLDAYDNIYNHTVTNSEDKQNFTVTLERNNDRFTDRYSDHRTELIETFLNKNLNPTEEAWSNYIQNQIKYSEDYNSDDSELHNYVNEILSSE